MPMYEDILTPAAGDAAAVERLTKLVQALRAPEGCPWDREQTHSSLIRSFMEETCEAIEAIENKDSENLCEELGDVLLQVAMHAEIGRENGEFTLADIANGVTDKMISRHPHVFGEKDENVKTASDVLDRWDSYKAREKAHRSESVLASMRKIPKSLPALLKADKLQAKAAKFGFDWDDTEPVFSKLSEETGEIREAMAEGDRAQVEKELGDLLFAAVNLARFLDVDPEKALNGCSKRFLSRLSYIDEKAAAQGKRMEDMSLDEMDVLWEEAKDRGL